MKIKHGSGFVFILSKMFTTPSRKYMPAGLTSNMSFFFLINFNLAGMALKHIFEGHSLLYRKKMFPSVRSIQFNVK